LIEKNQASKIIWCILEIADLLKKYGDQISNNAGITTQQWLIMLYLAGDPNIPYFEREKHHKMMMASELAEAFNVSRPNITNLLNGLLKKKLIKQAEDDIDRRKKRLQLTKKGHNLLMKLEPGRKAFNENLFRALQPEERNALLKFLEICDQTIVEDFTAEVAHK